MKAMQRLLRAGLFAAFALALCVASASAQTNGTLRGTVTDEFGGTIVGATVTATDASGTTKTASTNGDGAYSITGLAPGTYTVRAVAGGFAAFEDAGVAVAAGSRNTLDIKLSVALQKEEVTVAADSGISTAAESNADALVLKGKDLEALPDDPEDLTAALTALAGPSAGPNGGQIYIDGFTGGRLPPKESIREVRINQNPYNAENDRPGFGRVDILTRPGMDKFRGSLNTGFGDEALNSRIPFAPNRADYQSRSLGFNLSGPVVSKKSSFFVDFSHRAEDDNDVITATVLDPTTLDGERFDFAVLTPRRFTTFSPRFDYAFNENHTLVARYSYSQSTNVFGVGGFNLLSRMTESTSKDHNVQLTLTDVLNASTINETRFQFTHARREQAGDNSTPGINVLDSFFGGGASVGLSFNEENRWELQNYTTHTRGKHTIRFGARLRGVRLTDVSDSNFNGTFTFTSLAQYRSAVAGGGAVPSQLTLAGGNSEARVSQYDLGAFFQDEWRIRPNFSLTYGLRYETQSNISSHLNLAPRIFFAWAPGGTSTGTINPFGGSNAGQPKFVIRGGFGMFYDRFGERGTLDAIRFSGLGQQRFLVDDPSVLDDVVFTANGVSNVPTVEELAGFLQPQAVTVVADNLQAPRTLMTAVQAERQLPGNWTIFGVFFNYRQQRVFRQRNVNACLPGTFVRGVSCDRPDDAQGDIYQYESTGKFNDYRLHLGIRNQIRPGFSVWANYNAGKATSDTDCVFGGVFGCFPADSYDLSSENGRVAFFPRHQTFVGGSFVLPKLKLSFSPFIMARTGTFFNIITGNDRNGDGIFNDRPAFADEQTTAADLVSTKWGNFDRNPKPGQTIIPRNYGEGPGFFSLNMTVSRTFGFVNKGGAGAAAAPPPPQGGPRPGGHGGPGGGPGGPGSPEKRYNLMLSISFQNLLNRSNLSNPVGNLSSPFFGESTNIVGPWGGGRAIGGNRRIQLSARLNF